ncbi:hypothetical protein J6590_041795 [Homalodisca vitripennis]|nr:hypothetical protein J6590_041795 [Homalodisca vitripennis]
MIHTRNLLGALRVLTHDPRGTVKYHVKERPEAVNSGAHLRFVICMILLNHHVPWKIPHVYLRTAGIVRRWRWRRRHLLKPLLRMTYSTEQTTFRGRHKPECRDIKLYRPLVDSLACSNRALSDDTC